MGMSLGTGAPGPKAEINITPMIDVLLVLIIIFMVITPVASRGFVADVPQQASGPQPPEAVTHDLVISIAQDDSLSINQQPVQWAALHDRLAALYGRGAYHLFIRGDRGLEFHRVAEVLDIARAAGWNTVGLMTK